MQPFIRLILTLLLMIGIGATQGYVVGFEIHRFYGPAWFFVLIAGGLLLCQRSSKDRGEVGLYLLFSLLTLYIGLRGMFSAVPALSLKEIPLVCYGVIVFSATATLFRYRGSAYALTGFAVFMGGLQLFYQLSNETTQGALPRMWGQIKGFDRSYGLFRHYNPFASYCALLASTLGATLCVYIRPKGLSVLVKGFLLLSLGAVCYAAFTSGSRLGAGVTILAAFLGCSLSACLRIAVQKGKLASINRLSLILGVLVMGSMLSIGGFMTTFNKLSQTRGMQGSVSSDIVGGMRISSIGMGFSLWSEAPILGHGPRAYSYNAPRLRQQKSNYGISGGENHPDAEMVHNDYIQTLAEYGIVGLLLVCFTLSYLLWFLWKQGWSLRSKRDNWYLAPVIASSATVALLTHSLGDFTVHNLAVFLPYCFMLGGCWGASYQMETEQTGGHKIGYPLAKLGALLSSLGVLLILSWPQIVHSKLLFHYDYAKWHQAESGYLSIAEEVAEKAPDADVLEALGSAYLQSAATVGSAAQRQQLLTKAESYLLRANALHPYRIETLVNLTGVAQQLGKDQEAEGFLNQAFEWANERWNRYALGHLATSHLLIKGQELWNKRQAPEAMAYFLKALEYNTKGYYSQKDGYQEIRKQRQQMIEGKLQILEMGQVQPTENIEFFNGYGL